MFGNRTSTQWRDLPVHRRVNQVDIEQLPSETGQRKMKECDGRSATYAACSICALTFISLRGIVRLRCNEHIYASKDGQVAFEHLP